MDFEFIADVAEEERQFRTATLTGWEAVVFELEDEMEEDNHSVWAG